jgi:hypothetical protein
MAIKHNKKRNVGLIQEFLARHMAIAMVDNKPDKKDKAVQLISKHFKPASELHKEWMVFNSLVTTRVASKEVAHSLVGEAKRICRSISENDLERSKTTLIHDINHQLLDESFWDRSVKNYKLYATIQVLMNEWRKPSGSIGDIASLEDQLMEHLTRPEEITEKANLSSSRDHEAPPDALVIKLMTEKFNSKYNKVLNERQKKIVSLYLCAQEDQNDEQKLRFYLKDLGESVLFKMEKFANVEKPDSYLQDKLNETREFIETTLHSTEALTEDVLTVYLNFAKLEEELNSP